MPPVEFKQPISYVQEDGIETNNHGKHGQVAHVLDNADHLHRRLGNRQIQLIAIGGTIGTALFVSIGGALSHGGPGGLLLACATYCCFLALVNNSLAEMTVLFPVSGGFIRLAGHFVDDAFGFMAGWNFFLCEALLVPFEITALTTVLGFWSNDIPSWAIPIACTFLYGLINCLAVKNYGEAEFWLSGGKVILIFLLFSFTFVTMVGGNPKGDAYGFRYWRDPGAFAEYRSTGSLGNFEGLLACLWYASFTIVGPEYLSMVSAEAKRPRIYMKSAFKTIYFRFGVFFIGGALAAGLVIPYNDPTLVAINTGEKAGSGTAGASPYVIAMQNLGVEGLPHLTNALLCTSIFSAGNTYTYCAIRSLYGLALDGRAPKFIRYCTRSGIPIFALAVTMIFPCLSFLQVSKGSGKVLQWLIDLITGSALINYICVCVTYIFYHRACKVQGLDRKNLPYYGWYQPYCAYVGLAWMVTMLFCYSYTSFAPWSVQNFFIYYTMLLLAPVLFVLWKLLKRTTFVPAAKADLVWERPTIDAYEATFIGEPVGFWTEMIQLIGFKRQRGGNDQRMASISQT